MEELVAKKQQVYLRKINISNWKSVVADQYRVTSIPNFRVYGPQKQLLGTPTSSAGEVARLLRKAR